jgi:hypothetical protein
MDYYRLEGERKEMGKILEMGSILGERKKEKKVVKGLEHN